MVLDGSSGWRQGLSALSARALPLSSRWDLRIDQHAGVHHAFGIEFALGAAQRLGEQFGPLLVVERPVEAADGVVMRGRAALRHGGGGAGQKRVHELLKLRSLVEDAAEAEV